MTSENKGTKKTSTRILPSDSVLRTYHYDSSDLQELFTTIVESLGTHETNYPSMAVERILTSVCEHFRFGCGFVYEADHTQTFFLRENYASYSTEGLPESFRLEKHLDGEEIDGLLQESVFYQHFDYSEQQDGKTGVFDSSTFMVVPVLGKDNQPIGLVGMMDRRRNILMNEQGVHAARTVLNLLANHVKLRLYQQNLELAEASLKSILDNTGIDIYVNDFNTHEVLYVNKSMAAPYGGLEKVLGKKCWQALYTGKTEQCEYCPQKKLIDEEGNPTKVYGWDYRRPFDGSWFRVLSAAFRWVDGRLAHVVSSVDITENKQNEALIAKMANYDSLTNLPNRRKLMKDCQDLMQEEESLQAGGYLIFFDLDNFKQLNDTHGHQAGDELLTLVGRALQKSHFTKNRAYRYGGDEFIVLLSGVSREQVINVVQFLLDLFNQPWRLKDASMVCRASIGIAAYPKDAKTPDDLLHEADKMMYKAKQEGRGIACFTDGETVTPKSTHA